MSVAEVGTWSRSVCGMDCEVIEIGSSDRISDTRQILESPENFETMHHLTIHSGALTSLPLGCQIKR